MAFGFDVFEDVDQALVGPDEIRGPLYAFDQLSVHILRLDEIVTIDEGHLFIGKKIVGEVVLVLELLLRFDGVAGDAEHDDAFLLELLEGVTEAAGLDGAAGSISARIEEEHDRRPLEV